MPTTMDLGAVLAELVDSHRLLLNRFLAHCAHHEVSPLEGETTINEFFEALRVPDLNYVEQITRPRGHCIRTGHTFPAKARVLIENRDYDLRLTWQEKGKAPPPLGSRSKKYHRTEACLLLEDGREGETIQLVTGGQFGIAMIEQHIDTIRHAIRLPWLEAAHLAAPARRTLHGRTTLVV